MRYSTLIEHVQHGLIALPRRFMPMASTRAKPLPIKALAAKFNKYIVPTSNKSYLCPHLEYCISMAIKGLNTIL